MLAHGITTVGLGVATGSLLGSASKTGMLKLFDIRRARQTVIATSSPAEIAWGSGTLSARQQALLDALPNNLDRIKLHKSHISVTDLAALTAATGDEFALFTRGSQRLIIHGNKTGVDLKIKQLEILKEQGYRWSAHTHPSTTTSRNILDASGGDRLVLQHFEQERSLILDSFGRRNIFDQADNLHPEALTVVEKTSTTKLEMKP
jgi:hypothetical protein